MSQRDTLPAELKHARFTNFDVAQLRSVVFAYQKSPEEIPRSRTDLLNLLEGMRDEDINVLLARLEITQAYKHAYIYRLSEKGSSRLSEEVVAKWLDNNCELSYGTTKLFPLNYHSGEYISIRLVQPVSNFVIEHVAGKTYELRSRVNRHAVVIAIKPELGIAEVRFDGFEQSKQTPAEDKIDYIAIAEDCRALVEELTGDPVEGLMLRASVETMLTKHPKEVAQFGIKSRFKKGSISIDADESADGDLSSYLAEAFPGVDPSLAVTSPWTNKNINLKWPMLKMATRVNFDGQTSDVLFLWRRGSEKTLATTDHIIKRLVENSETWTGNARRNLDDAFTRLVDWGLITPADIAQAAGNVTIPKALEFLLEKTIDGAAELRYRYHTKELLRDYDNAWASSLAVLPSEVTTISGSTLQLTNPKNIEVGFELVGGA